LYELVAEERGDRLAVDVEPGLTVRADAGRLRQALANLVDNALKYGGHGIGDQGITVTLRARGNEGEVCLVVEDEGPGIPAEDLPRIFDRLYRGDRSRHERGLGLGLGFVRAIAEAHGGSVEVESTPGRGSVFTLRLPRRAHPPSAA
ncbi:MAG: sensor histidine kinase, partial [Planctomycetota bacterium]